jgi:hypothetical protein
MLIIFNVSSANSAGAAASASSAFVKKPKAVAHALRSNAFLRVDTASFSTSSFDVEEEHISRARIAEQEDTFFLIIPLLLAFVAKAFVCCEKPPDDFDDAPRREEAREDDRDDGIVVFDAEKEAEMFISCVSCASRREKKNGEIGKNLIDQKKENSIATCVVEKFFKACATETRERTRKRASLSRGGRSARRATERGVWVIFYTRTARYDAEIQPEKSLGESRRETNVRERQATRIDRFDEAVYQRNLFY